MNVLNPSVVSKLARLFKNLDYIPVHEHEAVQVLNLDLAITLYIKLGYKLVKRLDKVAFIQSITGKRLELIPLNVPEHNAWAAQNLYEWQHTYFQLSELKFFKEIPEYSVVSEKDFRAVMFRDEESGAVIQFVWRKEQIFENLFN